MHKIIISIPINNGCSTDDALSLLRTSFQWTVITTQHTQLHTCSYMYTCRTTAGLYSDCFYERLIYLCICLFVCLIDCLLDLLAP